MSRGLSAPNSQESTAASLHETVLVSLAYSTPVYIHSGIGIISFDGNDYLGLGDLGAIGEAKESELLGPVPVLLSLSGLSSGATARALDSGTYGDVITIYNGYRDDDGTLVDDPWIIAGGTLEFSSIHMAADDNVISVTMQHDLAVLDETEGSKFSDEDQRQRWPADEGFEYVADNRAIRLRWGDPKALVPSGGGNGNDWPPEQVN